MDPDSKSTYVVRYQVTWADMDLNGHMANSAYLDYATQTRFRYAASHGFTPADFRRAGVAPVMFEDRLTYHRELAFLDEFEVTHAYRSLDEAGRKFAVENLFQRDSETVASLSAHGGWLHLETRRVVVPPPELLAALAT